MGLLIALVFFAICALAIGAVGGVVAIRTHHLLASLVGTAICYYLLVGIPWALLIMLKEGNWLRSFGEAYFALSRSLLLLGLLPLLITFSISAMIER